MAGIISTHDTNPRAKFKSKTVVTKANAAFLGQLPPIKVHSLRPSDPVDGPRGLFQQYDPIIARTINDRGVGGHHESFLNKLDEGFHSGVNFIQREAEEYVKAVGETVDAAAHAVEEAAGTVGEAMTNMAGNIHDVITRKSSSIKYAPGEEPHDDYPETCLFIRKLKTGMHFELFGRGSKKQHCALLLSTDNSALQWQAGSKNISYRFEDLVKVDTLENTDSFRRAARARINEPRDSESCWFTLVFRDVTAPRIQASKRAKASSVLPSDLETNFAFVELSANTPNDRDYAVRGFELMRLHHRHHKSTHGNLKGKSSTPLSRIMKFTHHLYRPHHDSNCPPARWHDGTIVEVAFDLSFDVIVSQRQIEGTSNMATKSRLDMPCSVFQEGMFVRARVISFEGTQDGGLYQLVYKDGPYYCDEEPTGDLILLKMLPQGALATDVVLVNVNPTFISVDLDDNFKSEPPFFLLGISFLQIIIFLYYVFTESSGVADATSPIAGPEELWMKAVGPFPLCSDLRSEVWRLVSYQLVHAGIQHIGFNMVMQLIFGLPLNMVHGSIRFGFIYQLGVIGGALAFAVVDGAHGAVVGCSGGVYCIFGMHLAEVIMNGDADNKGVLNKWTRLLIISAILAADGVAYVYSRSSSTSYSAHIGGIIVGLLAGVVVLENLEVTWAERNVIIPGSGTLLCAFLFLSAIWYLLHSPPESLIFSYEPSHEPCCWALMRCETLEAADYSNFNCRARYDAPTLAWAYDIVYDGVTQETCADYTSAAIAARGSSM